MKNIERLIYTNEKGESVEFSHTSVFHLDEVSGLSDVRNTIYSVNSMGQDGDTYLGSRIESREIEIVVSIKERKKELAAEQRRRLVHVLNPHFGATLTYEFGSFKRVINCNVDNAPVFAQKELFSQAAIQLTCLNPFWRKENETREDIAAWVGAFEFPEEIEADKGWEIGYRQPSVIVNVFNEGDAKTGIRAEFKALGAVEDPEILNVDTKEFIKFHLQMQAGDVLTVSTGYGQKDVYLKRGGITSNAFRYIDPDSTYLQLSVGDNLIRYAAKEHLENLEVSIYHDDLYLGV